MRRKRLVDMTHHTIDEAEARRFADPRIPGTTVRLVKPGDGRPIDVETGEALDFHPPSAGRTPMQKTQDEVLDKAETHATSAFEEATESLAWLDLLVDLPKELRHTLPKLLGELQELIQNERRLRL